MIETEFQAIKEWLAGQSVLEVSRCTGISRRRLYDIILKDDVNPGYKILLALQQCMRPAELSK